MKKIAAWGLAAALVLFILDWGVLGVKLLGGSYDVLPGSLYWRYLLWRHARMRRMQGVHKPLPALREDNSIERKILSALRQRALTGRPRACILTCNALQ